LQYNNAIVSIKKRFYAIQPADILGKEEEAPPEKVVAIGRDIGMGLLMDEDCKL
jgi:hypothetical protein